VALGAGLFVWTRYLGGGPTLSAFAGSVMGGGGGGGGGGAGGVRAPTDRVGLLRPSAAASASRLESLTGGGGGSGGGGPRSYGASGATSGGAADNPFGGR
jgi:hypothetical protein